ncbi:ABC transporter permease [Rhodoblastus sphagnicola]|uniref:ABC transporter permease n=1 Tax=Rhodoblastus sphagnicola TaxID=333368 RepID=A0A2S6NGX9_9HYPH|nr:ABC transporter permease [Rhodoblastus sphagnicola]MBB4200261.1 NitT/TauT family transport system permease protein [Rhodoblastus sphagnicola]PPQ33863.1 ABC transporter permease [Rhodoblastus sphagnicola]
MADSVIEAPEISGFSAVGASVLRRRALNEVFIIIAVAVMLIGGLELGLRLAHVPPYIFPPPSAITAALVHGFWPLLPHIATTLFELISGFIIGASIGFSLAIIVTQFPFVEKIVTPYIVLLVTTPMIALVPLLILRLGFGPEPRIVAVALAAGPMVMLNSVTGFRRTDEMRISLARSFGATPLQVFLKIRIPQSLPMVLAGLTVGSIFGLLTAVAAEMAGGQSGIGTRLVYHSSMLEMPEFFAAIVVLAAIGVAIHLFYGWLGRKLVLWSA